MNHKKELLWSPWVWFRVPGALRKLNLKLCGLVLAGFRGLRAGSRHGWFSFWV